MGCQPRQRQPHRLRPATGARLHAATDPTPTPTPTPTPALLPSPTPTPDEGFAVWPETTPVRAEAVCGSKAPEWRADGNKVGRRFARTVLGWSDATNPNVLQLGKSGERVMSISRSEGEPGTRVVVSVAPTLFGPDCLSVVGVSRPDAGGPTGLSVDVDGAVVDIGWDPRGAASAEVHVGYGGLEQVQETTAAHCRFVFAGSPKDPGFFLVLLKDERGDVIGAMGNPLPAGTLTAG